MRSISDRLILICLLIITTLYIGFGVFYLYSSTELVNFYTFSYVVKRVLFTPNSLMSLNPKIAKLSFAPSVPLLYPPGIYIITRAVCLIKDTQLAMHIFIFVLQIITVFFTYLSLRKVSNLLVSASFTAFLIACAASITVVVDIFIQPLLAITVFVLLTIKDNEKAVYVLLLGILNGLIFCIRQNVGFFLTNCVLVWLLISSLSFEPVQPKQKRMIGIIITSIFLILGLIVMTIINNAGDKIWYVLPYLSFWVMIGYCFITRTLSGIRFSQLSKKIGLFLLPLLVILGWWFYAFGSIVGLKKYLYLQFLMPFTAIKLFEHPITFHLGLAYHSFINSIVQCTPKSFYNGYVGIMLWGVVFLSPFLLSIFCIAVMWTRIIRKSAFSKPDLQMASLAALGMLMFYPIESFLIVATKLILFVVTFAYFLTRFFGQRQRALLRISIFTLAISAPLLVARIGSAIYKSFCGVYTTYISVSGDTDVKLPLNKAREVSKMVGLIKNTVGETKFYIVDSYTDLEMLYGLTDYRHPNYYIFLRKDAMNAPAEEALLKALHEYPYIVINQQDYLSFKTAPQAYVARPRSIGRLIMDYIVNNYAVVTSYNRLKEVNDIWLADFFILKRIR